MTKRGLLILGQGVCFDVADLSMVV